MADRKREYGHGVVGDGKHRRVRFLSVSQLEKFSPTVEGGCNRKWYFEKVLRRAVKQTKAQAVGVRVHEDNETYLKTGSDVLGPLSRCGRHFMPDPGSDLLVEYDFAPQWLVDGVLPCIRDEVLAGRMSLRDFRDTAKSVLTIDLGDDVIPVVGFIDVLHRRNHVMTTEGAQMAIPSNACEVLDWKTTSDIDEYAKQGADLVKTIQMPGYAELASRIWPDMEFFYLSHVYFQTGKKGKRADKRIGGIDLTTKHERWQDASEASHREGARRPPSRSAAAQRGAVRASLPARREMVALVG